MEDQLKSEALAPLIDRYEFESHEQAFSRYQSQFSDTAGADFVTPDFLNEAFWVNLKDPTQSDALVESLSGLPGVEEVKDQRKYLDPIFAALNAASYTAIGIAALMLVAAVLLIATTIRLSAFSRRRELGIMRLVGASNRFIQTPFILEGVISALIGSVLAAVAVIAIVRFFVQGYLSSDAHHEHRVHRHGGGLPRGTGARADRHRAGRGVGRSGHHPLPQGLTPVAHPPAVGLD